MIYRRPAPDDPVDQGDIVDGCPLLYVGGFHPADLTSLATEHVLQRVLVLTQTCDFANHKVTWVVTAAVFDAQFLVDERVLKLTDVRGPIRGGRVYGWYFLPKNEELGLPESLVDLRQL